MNFTLKIVFILIISILLFSCNNERLDTSSLTITYTFKESRFSEQLFNEVINPNNNYIFILLNGDCSACMFELTWWNSLLNNYNKLHPIFIVTTENIGRFLIYAKETILKKYQFTFDKDRSFYFINKLNENIPSVITDGKLNILYKGDPIQNNSFLKVYDKLK